MVFSAPIFLFLFLPVALALGTISPRLTRNAVLLGLSLLFYAWGSAAHLWLLAASVLINWGIGCSLENTGRSSSRTGLLALGIGLDLAGLLYFKYSNFFVDNINPVVAWLRLPTIQHDPVTLPLGISFFTFHLLSYLLDIYRGAARAQRNPVDFGLYICFFPQLIAGPIIRYHDVENQLTDRRMSLAKFASGVERFIVGLGKKVLIANYLAKTADHIFALRPESIGAPVAWLGAITYGLQLYFDFSGYSDMAIGLGRMFGFEYLENFNYPFIATSISEFWRRWHISLSNWFRDYLYMPVVLAKARKNAIRGGRSGPSLDDRLWLGVVFLLCGFWHGANWTFLIWGAIHGVFLILERGRFGRFLRTSPRILRHSYVIAVLLLSWVFFRSATVGAGSRFLESMFGLIPNAAGSPPIAYYLNVKLLGVLAIALIGASPFFTKMTRDWQARAAQTLKPAAAVDTLGSEAHASDEKTWLAWARVPFLATLLFLTTAYIAGDTYNPFIYFRF